MKPGTYIPYAQNLTSWFPESLVVRTTGDPETIAQAARRIHADGIDILVDLKGYTKDARTEILAHRPAPVQVNFLGYPGSMGADFIDYILADAFVAPMHLQPSFTERIVHLPDSYQPYTTVQRFFYTWRDDGIWQRINHELVMLSREASGRGWPLPGG